MAAQYLIYSKPDCGHCLRAKTFLTAKGIEFSTVMFETEPEQRDFLNKLNGWNTWPAVFALGSNGKPSAFIGGASELIVTVNAP
jgi:glutaredoxin 3